MKSLIILIFPAFVYTQDLIVQATDSIAGLDTIRTTRYFYWKKAKPMTFIISGDTVFIYGTASHNKVFIRREEVALIKHIDGDDR